MSLILTLAGMAVVCLFTFFPEQLHLAPKIVAQLPIAAIALLTIAALLQLVALLKQLVALLRKKTVAEAPTPPVAAKAEPTLPKPSAEVVSQAHVVHFLGRLQEEGRLVDFAMDDLTAYSNEEIGAGARVVHQGCQEVLKEFFDIKAVHDGPEGEEISLAADFDARAYRLVGKVPERPPFNGLVLHQGWKTNRVRLPHLTDTAHEVIAPAEVEIG